MNIKIIVSSMSYINCLVFATIHPTPWQLTCVYGPLIPTQRQCFWNSLDSMGQSHVGPWLVIGDFYTVLSCLDKLGGKSVASSSNGVLRRVMDDHGLIYLGFIGHAFTWNNRRGGLANIQERLDRVANAAWKLLFPKVVITHLTALNSDHKPILLQTNPQMDNNPKSFKFESMWINHVDTGLVIQEAWNRHKPFLSKLKNTKLALKEWNKKMYGNVQENIKNLIESIQEL